jgi:hypothetical protein
VEWMLSHLVHAGRPTFPSWVRPGQRSKPARLAWCYGDPGVAIGILRAARVTGNAAHLAAATAIARQSATVPFAETGVKDAGLCHGAAGLALIYQRLFWATGDPCFSRGAHRWLEQVLDMRQGHGGYGGYVLFGPDRSAPPWNPKTSPEKPQAVWQADPSFLTGSVGVALALLASISSVPPDWD